MYSKISDIMYLVNNGRELNDIMESRLTAALGIKDDKKLQLDELALSYPTKIERMFDYPAFAIFNPMDLSGPVEMIPVMQAIGSLSEIHLLDFKNYFNNLLFACNDKQLVAAPRLMLNTVTIKERTLTKLVGHIAHVSRNGYSDAFAAVTKSLCNDPFTLRSICIKFGDNNLHNTIESNAEEYVFVTQPRDVTDLIATIEHDVKLGTYTPTYVFNHYNFLKGIPELAEYRDTNKWVLSFSISMVTTQDTAKHIG